MKRNYSRALVAFLAAIMCLCVCVFNVYAVPGEDGEVTPDPGGGDQSSAQSSDVPYIPDPPAEGGGDQSSAQSSDVPYIPESNNDNSSYDDGGGGYDGGGDNQTSYETDGGGESSNNVYYDSDGNSYSNQDDVYVGGGQNYQPPASTAPTAELYKTEKKVDVDELSKSDWGELSNLLKNNGAAESDGDDFAFIQNNTSKKDNGHWIVIAGLICILLSITGFIYLIASKISRRKKIKEGNITKTSDPQKKGAARRSNDDYDDGYGSKRKPEQKQQQDRRAERAKTVNRYSDEKTKTHYSSGKTTNGGKHGRRYR